VAGFRAWLALGYCVRKGERCRIRVWARCEPSRKKLQAWRDAGADNATKPKPFYRLEAVFDRAQVDALPAPAEPAPLDPPIAPVTGDTLAWALPELAAFADGLNVEVQWEPMPAGYDGWYRPREQRIAVNTEMAVNQQAAALVHELAHALVDLDRQADDPALDYATEELVAESVAHVVCRFVGLDTSANSIPYLAAWREDTAADAFERIAGLVDRLARRLEDALEAPGQEAAGPVPASTAR
jgi:antirestriction protein ArdC